MSSRPAILLVDDEINLQLTLGLILSRAGFPIWTASLSHGALEPLESGQFDLLFLDLQNPAESGLEVLGQIRSRFPTVPVMMLVPSNNEPFCVQASGYGKVSFLTKPVNPEQLVDSVREILGGCP